MDLKRAE